MTTKTRGPVGTAVVTGGSAGVGRATVRELARRGWDVAVLARGQEGVQAAVAEVEQAGRRGLALLCDVADATAVEQAADRVETELGPIDVWVNNAFAGSIALFEDVRPAEFERITDVTYLGQVNGTRAALRRMRPRDKGVVISVGSALAFRGIPLQTAYCGAKHAVSGFHEALRVELMHAGSKVEIAQVHLPALNTPQFDWVLHRGIDTHPQPVPPIYQPEVAARAIAHVAEHPRRTTWVGTTTALTILGNRVAPALLDRYLARSNVEAQQNPDKGEARDTVNLWEPVPGDHGAHGSFDDSAHARSPQNLVNTHRPTAAAGALLVAGAAVAAVRRLRS
jgi:NAD(P)-dependent dehydrogenase (short-subunit alcohol dehydrogenase family)